MIEVISRTPYAFHRRWFLYGFCRSDRGGHRDAMAGDPLVPAAGARRLEGQCARRGPARHRKRERKSRKERRFFFCIDRDPTRRNVLRACGLGWRPQIIAGMNRLQGIASALDCGGNDVAVTRPSVDERFVPVEASGFVVFVLIEREREFSVAICGKDRARLGRWACRTSKADLL